MAARRIQPAVRAVAAHRGGEASRLKFHGLSVFFPAYNDAGSLPGLLKRTFQTLEEHAEDFEVIVVNDGSRDHTAAVLQRLARRYAPYLRIVTHENNCGYGAALRSGLDAARKEFVFYTDGDGQYDSRELPLLLGCMGPKVGLVNGYKIERNDPPYRVWVGRAYNFCVRALFGIRIRDVDCDFRLMRRSLLNEIELTSTSGAICLELVRKLERTGWEIAEAPVHHFPRAHGQSQFFRIRPLLATFGQLIQLWFRTVAPR
jgi:glycosyltransferase involved in cell wall biosynthesis